MSKRSIKMTESRNGMTVAQFYDKVSEVKDYLPNDTPLFAKFGDSTWCINSAYANRRELILTDSQGFTCNLARLYELKKSNELGQKKAVYFIVDGGGGLFRIDSVRIKSDDRGSNKTLVLELLKDFSFESEEPVNDDVGTVDVHYIYSDGDSDDDTGHIVQWEDYYEVQSDLHCAQGKTLEELKANFETEVMSNLDYDVEDAEFEWNIEEDLEESKQDMFSKRKSESCFKKNRITEDSLDDFDVDGKIAAANKVAMSDEKLQSAIKSIKEQYSDYLYEAVGRLFSSYDLQEVNKEFLKPGEFKCFVSSNMFGGSSRVGSTFYVVFEIGDRYRGALPEHVKLDYNEKRAAVQQFAKELQDEINEIIDEAKAKGFAVHRLQGYGDVFVRDVSQMGSECIEIKISCKITQEEVNSLMESVKTKSKKISEAKIQESEESEEKETLSLYELGSLLRKARTAKEKASDDVYAEVSISNCYCGGGFEWMISYSGSDEGMPPLYYLTFLYEDDDFDGDVYTGINLRETILEAFKAMGYMSELKENGYPSNLEIYVPVSEIHRLEDIANGQGFLFEKRNMKVGSENAIEESTKRIREASISKVKKFGTPYLEKIADKAQGIADAIEKENNYKLELCGPEYDAYQTASDVVGTAAYYLNTNHDWRANKKFFRMQLYQMFEDPVEFFGLDCKNGHDGFGDEFFQACHEDGIMPYMRKYIKESDILEALDFVEKEVYQNKINTGKEKELLGKSIEKDRKDKEEREARHAAQAAKFAKDTKFLQDAAKTAKVVIDEIEGYSRPDDWSVILDTEDDYKANAFRNAVGDLLEGTENAYGASYDDIPGMGSIHLGCIQYYEWSEMNGGDVYDDLDENIREKYVVFACPKKKWIDYRRRTDC